MTSMVGMYMEFKAKSESVDNTFKRLHKEVDNLKAKQNTANAGFTKMTNLIKGIGVAFLSWKAVEKFFSIIKSGLSYINELAAGIDKITDSARGLGVSATAFQQLKFMAEQSGVEVESLHGLIKKMNMTLAQAATGDKKIKFLDIAGFDNMSKEDRLTSILQQLGKIEDQTLQDAAAFEIFGRQSDKALQLARDGAAANVDEFNRMGIALTDSQRKAVDSFGDSKNKLETLWTGFSQKVVANLATPFEKAITYVTDLITSMGGMDKVAQNFADAIVNAMAWAIDKTAALLKGVIEIYKIYTAVQGRRKENQILDIERSQQASAANAPKLGETKYSVSMFGGVQALPKDTRSYLHPVGPEMEKQRLMRAQAEDEARFNGASNYINGINNTKNGMIGSLRKGQQENTTSNAGLSTNQSFYDNLVVAADGVSKFDEAIRKVSDGFEEYFTKLNGGDTSGILKEYEELTKNKKPDQTITKEFNKAGAKVLEAFKEFKSFGESTGGFDKMSYREMLSAIDDMETTIQQLKDDGLDTTSLENTLKGLLKYADTDKVKGAGYTFMTPNASNSPMFTNKDAEDKKTAEDLGKAALDAAKGAVQQVNINVDVKASPELIAIVTKSQGFQDAVSKATKNELQNAAISGAK